MKIIIVDDEYSSLNTFLSNIIDENDLSYTMFMNNPDGALDWTQNNQVDVAFLDINMPKINGVELAKQLISISPNIFIVFITGFDRDEENIKKVLGKNLLGFCNKPYDKQLLLTYISKVRSFGQKRKIFFKTFSSFDLFINGKSVEFSRAKSKELLAILVDRQGSSLLIGEAVALLWQDKQDELAKRLYRDAVSRLRLVLEENDLLPIVNFGRGILSLNCENITCDLWNFLKDKNDKSFYGDYMVNYEWSFDRQNQLCAIANERNLSN